MEFDLSQLIHTFVGAVAAQLVFHVAIIRKVNEFLAWSRKHAEHTGFATPPPAHLPLPGQRS